MECIIYGMQKRVPVNAGPFGLRRVYGIKENIVDVTTVKIGIMRNGLMLHDSCEMSHVMIGSIIQSISPLDGNCAPSC